VKQIRCARCERLSELGEMEFEEFVSLDRKAGYMSASDVAITGSVGGRQNSGKGIQKGQSS